MSFHSQNQFNQNPPNPLRPYYIPPPPYEASTPSPSTSAPASNVPSSYALLQDFHEYSSDYLESPSAGEAMRRVLDQAILKYTSILISQPFEVAKTVLQCQYVPRREGRSKHHPRDSTRAEEEDVGDSEEEEAKEESEEDNPWTTFETEVRLSPAAFYFFFVRRKLTIAAAIGSRGFLR
jgi:fusion and transport protein UGO1